MTNENSTKKIDRSDINIVSRHSNLGEAAAHALLEKNVYNDVASWKKFLHLLFIVLGIGFTVSGIIFFFAYNWESLHKFAKMGILEVLVVASTLAALFFKSLHILVKKSILTGAAMLVGALFAVYGQIYQTGANAYDFFLAWTLAVTIWVLVANFAPLWLLYVTLVNTTIILYFGQIAPEVSFTLICLLLFALNVAALFIFILLSSKYKEIDFPVWFRNILALACVCLATVELSIAVWEPRLSPSSAVFLLLASVAYIMGIQYGRKARSIFFYAIISLSGLYIASSLLLRISSDIGMFLILIFLDLVGITMLVKYLFKIQKKWADEDTQTDTDDIQTTD
jgi:uncharacterized membrane protein